MKNKQTIIERGYNAIIRLYKRMILRDPFTVATYQWTRDKKGPTLMFTYPLNTESVVFDVGGYRGDWAQSISEKYHPYVWIFEPITSQYEYIAARFDKNPHMLVWHMGLAGSDASVDMTFLKESSSIFKKNGITEEVQMRDIATFFYEHHLDHIDLIKINIEGGEYELLERMIESGLSSLCTDIQVQFHDFVANASLRRDALRAKLAQTHELTYNYDFVWENWHLKNTSSG